MVWTKPAHFVTGRCPREGIMLCRAAKADETSLRPAIPARISSTKRGRITNCATNSIRSRRFRPILGSRSSFAGFTGSRKERSSEPGVTENGPTNPIDDVVCSRLFFRFVPWLTSALRPSPDENVVGDSVPGVVNSDEEEQKRGGSDGEEGR